jgi:CheY-like chemotaxis protein
MIPLVLSVDDDKVTQMLNQMIFKRAGFSNTSVTCMNGKEALQFFEHKAAEPVLAADLPVIIFLDLNMPVMDGWEFLEIFTLQYAAAFPTTKVVILSSTINPLEKEKALINNYVIDFFCKPLTLEMLATLKNSPEIKQYF